MFPAHVGPVDIVGAEDDRAFEVGAAEIHRHQFAQDLAAAVGITRIRDVRNRERRRLVRRHGRRRLIDLGTRRHHQVADPVFHAAIDHIHHALHADIQNQVRLLVEEARPVHIGEMANAVHALDRIGDRLRLPDIRLDELAIVDDLRQATQIAARVVVHDADPMAVTHESSNEHAAKKSGASGD